MNHTDKIAHFAVSALIAIAATGLISIMGLGLSFCSCTLLGGAVGIVAGGFKECRDYMKGGEWSMLDFLADLAGCGMGMMIAQLFE